MFYSHEQKQFVDVSDFIKLTFLQFFVWVKKCNFHTHINEECIVYCYCCLMLNKF